MNDILEFCKKYNVRVTFKYDDYLDILNVRVTNIDTLQDFTINFLSGEVRRKLGCISIEEVKKHAEKLIVSTLNLHERER